MSLEQTLMSQRARSSMSAVKMTKGLAFARIPAVIRKGELGEPRFGLTEAQAQIFRSMRNCLRPVSAFSVSRSTKEGSVSS